MIEDKPIRLSGCQTIPNKAEDKSISIESDLKECPCGKIPELLNITDAGQGGKWFAVDGGCCGEWEIEFRTMYYGMDSDECMKLAIEAWNDAPRSQSTQNSKIQALIEILKPMIAHHEKGTSGSAGLSCSRNVAAYKIIKVVSKMEQLINGDK